MLTPGNQSSVTWSHFTTLQAEKGAQPKHRVSVNKEEEAGYWRTVSGFIHKAGDVESGLEGLNKEVGRPGKKPLETFDGQD